MMQTDTDNGKIGKHQTDKFKVEVNTKDNQYLLIQSKNMFIKAK